MPTTDEKVAVEYNKAVANVIKGERAIHGITYEELADKSEIPERTLYRLLDGSRDIRVAQLMMLAEALGLSSGEIIDEAKRRIARGVSRH